MDDRLAEIKADQDRGMTLHCNRTTTAWLIAEVERLKGVHEAGVALLTEACRQRSDLADEGTELRAEVERLTNLQSSMVLQAIKAYDDGIAEGIERAAVIVEGWSDDLGGEADRIAAAIRALTV